MDRFKIAFAGFLIIILVVPRVALLFNGLDSQRIWDTNTPAAFQFLAALQSHRLVAFWESGQKYPLLGSYSFVPVIGAYYAVERVRGVYTGANDFIAHYATGETQLFFWIRLQMIALNVLALYVLFATVKRYTSNAKARWHVLVLGAVNFYITFFSVMPRIHSFAFLTVALTLAASLRLLKDKSPQNYWLAFGAAVVAGSVSQSGVPAIILPLLASQYDAPNNVWKWRIRKPLVVSVLLYVVFLALLGYPRTVVWLISSSLHLFSNVILGSNHIIPAITVTALAPYYLYSTEIVTVWFLVAGLYARLVKKLKLLSVEDVLALAHVVIFFGVFSVTNIFSGRFMLAVMPSVLFLSARLWATLESYRWFRIPLYATVAFQLFGVIMLTHAALGGDTRSDAASWILNKTRDTAKIATNIDPILLGIVPTPESVGAFGNTYLGTTETLIRDQNLVGSKSRFIVLTTASTTPAILANLDAFDFVVRSSALDGDMLPENLLREHQYRLVHTVYANMAEDPTNPSFIPWDFITPKPAAPQALALIPFISFGPTIEIYERIR